MDTDWSPESCDFSFLPTIRSVELQVQDGGPTLEQQPGPLSTNKDLSFLSLNLEDYLLGSPTPVVEDAVVPEAPLMAPSMAPSPAPAHAPRARAVVAAAVPAEVLKHAVHANNKRALDARWSDELISMEQHEFRHWLKENPMPREDEVALKKARRRAKNRAYAKKARTKRIAKQSGLVVTHASLQSDNARLTEEVAAISAKLEAELAAKARLVRFVKAKFGEAEAARLLSA